MRIEDTDWKRMPPEFAEWADDVTELLNAGKVAIRYYGTTTPGSTTVGQQGEMLLAKDGVTWRVFVYTDDTDKWQII